MILDASARVIRNHHLMPFLISVTSMRMCGYHCMPYVFLVEAAVFRPPKQVRTCELIRRSSSKDSENSWAAADNLRDAASALYMEDLVMRCSGTECCCFRHHHIMSPLPQQSLGRSAI